MQKFYLLIKNTFFTKNSNTFFSKCSSNLGQKFLLKSIHTKFHVYSIKNKKFKLLPNITKITFYKKHKFL